jgi:hypothetical protein
MGEERNAYTVSIGKPKREPPERFRNSWDNIKMYLKEIGWEDMD